MSNDPDRSTYSKLVILQPRLENSHYGVVTAWFGPRAVWRLLSVQTSLHEIISFCSYISTTFAYRLDIVLVEDITKRNIGVYLRGFRGCWR